MSESLSNLIETTARHLVANVIAAPGWGEKVEEIIPALADTLRATDTPHHEAISARAAAILREVATCNPEVIFEKYLDLLPADLRALMLGKAIEALKESGATVETFKDEAGTTFLKLGNVEALGIPEEEMERLNAMAPGPVGPLHRVQ